MSQIIWTELLRPAQLGIAIAVGVFWWAHRYIPIGGMAFLHSKLGELLN